AHERLLCLDAYLRKSQLRSAKCQTSLLATARYICHLAGRLLRQRRIREICKVPAPHVPQRLIWQDGEALCLTPEFHAYLGGHIPGWLRLGELSPQPGTWEKRSYMQISDGRKAVLIQRRQSGLLFSLRALLGRRPLLSPEVRRAGLHFRLERYGIGTARLLA